MAIKYVKLFIVIFIIGFCFTMPLSHIDIYKCKWFLFGFFMIFPGECPSLSTGEGGKNIFGFFFIFLF